MSKVKDMRKVLLPFFVVLLSNLSTNVCYAYTYQTLEEAKAAAWNAYYKEDIVSHYAMDKDIAIDGAVDKGGGVKVNIEDWQNTGILKEGDEFPIWDSPKQGAEIGKIYTDTIFSIVAFEGDWVKIHSGYLIGYVRSSDIYVNDAAKKRAQEISPVQILSNMVDTRLQKEPKDNSITIDYMVQRKRYDIKGMEKGWYQVRYKDGVDAYVRREEVTEVQRMHLGRTLIDLKKPQQPYIEIKLNAEDRRLLAATIYCEARGESFEGQIAVGSVVLNRVHSEEFPDTVPEVIYQDNQFEPVSNNQLAAVIEDDRQIAQSCYEAADVVIQGGSNIDALYFRMGNIGTQIGNHGFY